MLRDAVLGPRERNRLRARATQRNARAFVAVAEDFAARGFKPPDDDTAPVFVLAAGWRSGSTLVQRMLMASGTRLVWGEPFNASTIVQRLRAQLQPFDPSWPRADQLIDGGDNAPLSESWVADLYPPVSEIWHAHRAFIDRLLAVPAAQRGFREWGLKEVRLDIDDAHYLQWLYPRARFILLVRNPFDAWRSYRAWRDCFNDWPHGLIDTPTAFGRLWCHLAGSFGAPAAGLRSILVQYESLREPATAQRIEEFLGEHVVGARELPRLRGAAPASVWLPSAERWLLGRAVRPLAGELGYRGPSANRSRGDAA